MSIDVNLEQRVVQELQQEPGLEKCQIRASVDDGMVFLDGYVDRYAASELAGRAVFRVSGVRGLVNRLGSNGGATPG
jgi:osmotically-inducible protein OsmY